MADLWTAVASRRRCLQTDAWAALIPSSPALLYNKQRTQDAFETLALTLILSNSWSSRSLWKKKLVFLNVTLWNLVYETHFKYLFFILKCWHQSVNRCNQHDTWTDVISSAAAAISHSMSPEAIGYYCKCSLCKTY